ncbi:hypothetical protein [Altericista sp. CCNU0014]|uniref:hypothetical protein n=1 Tax=Altericista sp. CCNU0014 TaxID=3082949 RepID=UPI00384CEC30
MTFLNSSEPLLQPKQAALDIQDLKGLLHIRVQLGSRILLQSHYTRIDQIFVLWGVLSSLIFATAQFVPLAWTTQAWIWSILTIGAALAMTVLSWCWTGIERLRWLIWLWVSLLVVGVSLTDYSIFQCWGWGMAHLSELWLLVCAVGYWATGWGLKSRSLGLTGLVHLLGCLVLPWTMPYQFLFAGLILASTLFFLGEYQWDMRPPVDFANLTPSQRRFNQQQHLLRQAEI